MTAIHLTPNIPPSIRSDMYTMASDQEKVKGFWSKMGANLKMALKKKNKSERRGGSLLVRVEEAIRRWDEANEANGSESVHYSAYQSRDSLPKSDEVPYHMLVAKSRFYNPPVDEYYGREQTAKACAGFMLAFFPDSELSSPTESESEIDDLARFIAYLLQRTRCLPISIHTYALFLLSRLRNKRVERGCLFPTTPVDPAYRERLYLAALIVASKTVCHRHFMNQSWCLFSRGMFSTDEVDAMEQAMYGELKSEVVAKPEEMEYFESVLRQGYGSDFLAHDDPAAGMVNAPLRRKYSSSSLSSCSSCSSCSSGGPKCQI